MCLVKVREEEEVVVPYRVAHNHKRTASRSSARRVSRTEIVRESRDVVRPPSISRISRPPSITRVSASYVAVPAPTGLLVPAPQPVPIFVQPEPHYAPPPPSHISERERREAQYVEVSPERREPQYVEVSPSSSVTSYSPSRASPSRASHSMASHSRASQSRASASRVSDHVVYEREREYVRRRDDEPRYEHFRYVDAAPEPDERYERVVRRERSRSRARSRGREYGYEESRGSDRGYEDPRGGYRETRERVVMVDDDARRKREYRR